MDPIQKLGKKNILTVFTVFFIKFKISKGTRTFISGQKQYYAILSKYEIELLRNNVVI